MDLILHEMAQAVVQVEEGCRDLPMDGLLPSPLAEMTARTAIEPVDGASSRERCRSRPGRPAPSPRRKQRRSRRRPPSPAEVVVGTLAGINDSGQPLVRHPLDPSGRITLARTTVPIGAGQVDREVVIAFASGDISKPVVLGVLQAHGEPDQAEPRVTPPAVSRPIVQATLDGEQLVLTARKELVLRCGKASLTLTRAGKILLRGTYLLSRSSGVNRIKGGSVQIN
jgi:hypothetical protein